MARRILGLDLGAGSVKGVVLESAYRGFEVVDAAAAPVEAGDAPLRDRQLAAVRALLAGRAGAGAEAVIVGFPGASASSHVVTLPFTDARRIEQTIGFELEGQIPFDLGEVAWDWQVLGTTPGRSEVLVALARKEELAALLSGLAEAGVDPRAVVPAAPAYAALHATGAVAPAGGPELVVDVGAGRTSACVVARGQAEWARTVLLGAAELAAGPSPLLRELRSTLKAWRARFPEAPPLARVLLAGAAPAVPGLADALAAETGAAVEPVAFAGPAAARIPAEEAPAYALALALAARGFQGARAPRLNLRRGELAYTRDFQHLRGRIVKLAAAAGLVAALALVAAGTRLYALKREEQLIDRALCEATQKILGKCYDDFAVAESILRGRGTPAAAIPRLSSVDVLAELAARAPSDVKFRLDRIEITRDKLHLQGTTEAAENVDRIVAGLRGGRCFGDARSGGVRRRGSEQRFEFTIDSDLTCDVGGAAAATGGRG